MLALAFDSWNRSQFQKPQGIDFSHPYVDVIIITTNLGSYIFLKNLKLVNGMLQWQSGLFNRYNPLIA